MVKASTFTESLAEIAKAVFGSEEKKESISTAHEAMSLAASLNLG